MENLLLLLLLLRCGKELPENITVRSAVSWTLILLLLLPHVVSCISHGLHPPIVHACILLVSN